VRAFGFLVRRRGRLRRTILCPILHANMVFTVSYKLHDIIMSVGAHDPYQPWFFGLVRFTYDNGVEW
jgi:hypothetical protein